MRRIGSFAVEVRRVNIGARTRESLRSSMLNMSGAGFVSKEAMNDAIVLPAGECRSLKSVIGLRAHTSETISVTSLRAFSDVVSKPQMSCGSTGRDGSIESGRAFEGWADMNWTIAASSSAALSVICFRLESLLELLVYRRAGVYFINGIVDGGGFDEERNEWVTVKRERIVRRMRARTAGRALKEGNNFESG